MDCRTDPLHCSWQVVQDLRTSGPAVLKLNQLCLGVPHVAWHFVTVCSALNKGGQHCRLEVSRSSSGDFDVCAQLHPFHMVFCVAGVAAGHLDFSGVYPCLL